MMPENLPDSNPSGSTSPYAAHAERVVGAHIAAVHGLGSLTRKLLGSGATPLRDNLSYVISGPANARAQALGQPKVYDSAPKEQGD